MKIRSGFISNSSSSSFVIAKAALTPKQINQIKNYHNIAVIMNRSKKYKEKFEFIDHLWIITEDDHTLVGETDMTNFDMFLFLDRIGVSKAHIKRMW